MSNQWTFSDLRSVLSVGMVVFDGAVDLEALLGRFGHSSTTMNKNDNITTSVTIPVELASGERPYITSMTLYASRIDISVKKHKHNKAIAMQATLEALDASGVHYVCNAKSKSKKYTITLYDYGAAQTLEQLCALIAGALEACPEPIEGSIDPDYAKGHIRGCRRDADIARCCDKILEVLGDDLRGLTVAKVYLVMHVVSYELTGIRIKMCELVRYITTLSRDELNDAIILYDNTRAHDSVTIMWNQSERDAVSGDEDIAVWRNSYDSYITIKQNGKIDHSSFSSRQDVTFRHFLHRLLTNAPPTVFVSI